MIRPNDFRLQVDDLGSGMRLDVFVGSRLTGCSRSLAGQLIASGHVHVDGQPKKPGYRLKSGDVVTGRIPPPRPTGLLAEPIPLHILYEDAHIVVVNKQPGLVVHPAPGHYSGTLVNGLLYHCPDLGGIGEELRPGIVHRLDKDTSGTLVVAKTAAAVDHLSGQFKRRTVEKNYLALVHGEPSVPNGAIRLPIGRHPVDRKRMSTRSRKGREAETAWRVVRRLDGFTLLELQLKTGRTHQIRVHCAAIGHPIIGDSVYSRRRIVAPPSADKTGEAEIYSVMRQMLHAWRLKFQHPYTGARMQFESPLPLDMKRLIKKLETHQSG